MGQFEPKNCKDCEHFGSWYDGGSLYEPPDYGWGCKHEEEHPVDRLIELHDTKAATWCKHYKEAMFGDCPVCRKVVNQPLKDWKIFCSAWDCEAFPVCSEECNKVSTQKAQYLYVELGELDQDFDVNQAEEWAI